MNLGIINLSGGEFTPKVDVRSDTEKYPSGCRILDNMIPVVYGVVTRRTGTEFISYTIESEVILSYILAYENNVVCSENRAVTNKDSTWIPEFMCYENDVVCYENNVVSMTNYFFEDSIACYENNILFYENDVLTLGI